MTPLRTTNNTDGHGDADELSALHLPRELRHVARWIAIESQEGVFAGEEIDAVIVERAVLTLAGHVLVVFNTKHRVVAGANGAVTVGIGQEGLLGRLAYKQVSASAMDGPPLLIAMLPTALLYKRHRTVSIEGERRILRRGRRRVV